MGHLSIVPSWNWNLVKFIGHKSCENYQSYHRGIEIIKGKVHIFAVFYYQSYHRGIEILVVGYVFSSAGTINRTIVELKSKCSRTRNAPPAAINRTIVELKLLRLPYYQANFFLLSIVPSWNWNHRKTEWPRARQGLSIVPSWNWNNVVPWGEDNDLPYQSYHRGIEIPE